MIRAEKKQQKLKSISYWSSYWISLCDPLDFRWYVSGQNCAFMRSLSIDIAMEFSQGSEHICSFRPPSTNEIISISLLVDQASTRDAFESKHTDDAFAFPNLILRTDNWILKFGTPKCSGPGKFFQNFEICRLIYFPPIYQAAIYYDLHVCGRFLFAANVSL